MAIPKFDETFLPLLQILADGQVHKFSELPQLLLDNGFFELTPEELHQKISDGSSLYYGRVGWGVTYLNQAKLVERPMRGHVRITPKGLAIVQRGLTHYRLADIKQDADFSAHEPRQGGSSSGGVAEVSETNETTALSPQDMLDQGQKALQASLRRDLLARLYEVNPYYFQRIVLELFRQMGYGEFVETPKSGDGGIDGIINRDELGLERIYMQAKRYGEGNKVREPEIRNFIGAMSSDVTKGIFVTTSDFDSKAIEKVRDDHHHKIILINGSQLAELMIKYHIGVQTKAKYEVLEIDEDYFEGE